MTTRNIEAVVPYLPEVGTPIERRAGAIVAVLARIEGLKAEADVLRRALLDDVRRIWSQQEIDEAERAAYEAARAAAIDDAIKLSGGYTKHSAATPARDLAAEWNALPEAERNELTRAFAQGMADRTRGA